MLQYGTKILKAKKDTHSQNMDKKCLNFEHVRQKFNFDFER